MLSYEQKAKDRGFDVIIGVDEVGRGPLAGPVVAAAVCLKTFDFDCRISDSKKLTSRQRIQAFHEIFDKAYVGIGTMSEVVIDEVNILNASFLAMNRAVRDLVAHIPESQKSEIGFDERVVLLIDGNRFKSEVPYKYKPVIKGDSLSLSIACASIIAKVYRDRWLEKWDGMYPEYGFKQHKGYPTKKHRQAILEYGYCPLHRRSFQVQL